MTDKSLSLVVDMCGCPNRCGYCLIICITIKDLNDLL